MQDVRVTCGATINASASIVYMNGKIEPRLRCSAIEASLGSVPSRAILTLGSVTQTEFSPRTLLSNADYERWKFGCRVKVTVNGDTIFLGQVTKRSDQGQTDSPSWIAEDDRWLLSLIPIRGCLVNDVGYKLKYATRYHPVCNPSGMWNCCPISVNGEIFPMFSSYAQSRKTDAEQTFAGLTPDENSCWTPRRAIEYLRYLAMIADCDGFKSTRYVRTLRNSTRIAWNANSLPPIEGYDPNDFKLQTLKLGPNLLAAVCNILDKTGTHELGIVYQGDKSVITFSPLSIQNEGADIPIRRGGAVAESSTAVDFDLMESCEETAESVLVEGDAIKTETSVIYQNDAGTDTLTIAWDATHETNFKMVVWGAAEGEEKGTYAKIPSTPDGEPDTPCDGNGTTPLVYAGTQDAVALARSLYPSVYMDYNIVTWKLAGTPSAFAGTDNEFQDEETYPVIKQSKNSFMEQLSKVFYNGNTIEQRLPVRIEVSSAVMEEGNSWIDAPYLNGFLTSPTTIRIQGLAENSNAESWCVYSGNLLTDTWNCAAKAIRINLALPLDHRVEGYKEISENETSEMDPDIMTEIGGRLIRCETNPSYVREYRYNSKPRPTTVEAENGDLENSTDDALRTAERLLKKNLRPEKRSSWTIKGVRLDWTAGLYVKKLRVFGQGETDIDYVIDAPVKSVVYDFIRQETRIGGLLSQAPAPSEPTESEPEPEPEPN